MGFHKVKVHNTRATTENMLGIYKIVGASRMRLIPCGENENKMLKLYVMVVYS